MPTPNETIERIVEAPSWNQRVAQIRLIPQHHGTGEHQRIFAEFARMLYVPHLAPDFAYIHEAPFYEKDYFLEAYAAAHRATGGFVRISEDDLTEAIRNDPKTLLVFRTILGLTREEFAHSTTLAAMTAGLPSLSSAKVDSMERQGSATGEKQARACARTVSHVMDGSLFGEPPPGLLSKLAKPDTERGWESIQQYANSGVPLAMFLHQRHYGGAFRQILDATSTQRGKLIEDAVEALFNLFRVQFPAACGVALMDERIHSQEPQRDGIAVPLGISGKVSTISD